MSPKIVRGSVEYENGDKWEGEFVDDKPGGRGKCTYANGCVYEGGWADGKPNGVGKKEYAAGGVLEYYEGEWENGKPHGKGICTYRRGDKYEGTFVSGMAVGIGKYTWSNGDVYEGEWKKGDRHGSGTKKYADGRVYTGEWADDMKHGSGILKLTDGEELKQEYKHGQLLSSKRVATLTNGPPSQRPRTGNAVSNMLVLNEDYTTCDICMESFTFDRNAEDDRAKKRLPVLSKSCDHWCCHGCVLREQARRAGLAEDGASPTWIPCMKCRKADEFCPSEPRYDRRLIDMLNSSIPVREKQPAVVENDGSNN